VQNVLIIFSPQDFTQIPHLDSFLSELLFSRRIIALYSPCAVVGFQIEAPILFLAGQLDEMVPPARMQQLYEAVQETSSAQLTSIEFPDGMHMDTWVQGGERY